MRFYTTKEIIDWTTTIPFMLKEHLELLTSLESTEGSFYPSSSHLYSDIDYSHKQYEFRRNFNFLIKHGFLEYAEEIYDDSSGEEHHFKYKFTIPSLALREIMISIERKNFLDTLKGLMNAGIDAN